MGNSDVKHRITRNVFFKCSFLLKKDGVFTPTWHSADSALLTSWVLSFQIPVD